MLRQEVFSFILAGISCCYLARKQVLVLLKSSSPNIHKDIQKNTKQTLCDSVCHSKSKSNLSCRFCPEVFDQLSLLLCLWCNVATDQHSSRTPKRRLIGPQLPLSHPLVFSQSERGCWSMTSAFLTPSPSLPSPPPNILSFHTFLHIQLRSKVEL